MTSKRKSQPSAEHYSYRVGWSVKDAEFMATVVEFPSLSWIACTREGALEGLTALIDEILQDMPANGEEIPAPWDEREFSGKFNVRLGPDLHKKLALRAAERGDSMNNYVMKQLA